MSQEATKQIIPYLMHLGDLHLESSLAESEFYKSYINQQGYNYYIFGLLVIIIVALGYLIKLIFVLPQSKERGSILPHILAIKCAALSLYPTFSEYINFCSGFMTADIPWFNQYFGTKFGDSLDLSPHPIRLHYTNMSLVSTYFVAAIVAAVLWGTVSIIGHIFSSC